MNIKLFKPSSIEMLEEATLNQLHQSTSGAFPSRDKNAAGVRITNKSFMQYGQDLLIKATCAGETDTYECQMLIEGVKFTDAADPSGMALHGGLHIHTPSIDGNDVKVRCSCMDFHWTFAWQNSGSDALIGDPPPPYQKTSDKRGPRNPTNAIGICKHLIKLKETLQTEGLFG